jgi:sarcosine oxidase delta subunit
VTPLYYKHNSKGYCKELYHKNGKCKAFKVSTIQPTTSKITTVKNEKFVSRNNDEDTNTSTFLVGQLQKTDLPAGHL